MENTITENSQIKVALDAMGGDFAPEMAVKGAVLAAREHNANVILVGDEAALKAEIVKNNALDIPFEIRHAPEVIAMGEKPQAMIRKKKASLRLAFETVKNNEAQGIVSAGNSGAVLYGALFVLKRLKLVSRPGIAARMPAAHGTVVIIDAGANALCKPENLIDFSIMGESYFRNSFGVRKPRVGLLSNGAEDTKGTDLTRTTHEFLKKGALNYIGYIEGRDVFGGEVDVVVCDGFTGNIVIKTAEGVAHNLTSLLRSELRRSIIAKLGYLLSRTSFRSFTKRLDYREYGGALLLGVNKPVVFAHGSSNERAFMNAIRVACEYAKKDIVSTIQADLEQSEDVSAFKKRHPLIRKILRPFSSKEKDGGEDQEGSDSEQEQEPVATADKNEMLKDAPDQSTDVPERSEK
jgi:glycerol-3-phosphate acyltransferase PlsX